MKIKAIKNYEGLYEVSEFGNIYSVEKFIVCGKNKSSIRKQERKEKSFRFDKYGYKRISLSKNGKVKTIALHRIVAENFIKGNSSLTVNHKDGNKLNNHFSNLEWVSNRENINHYHLNTNKTSKYPGVHFKKDVKKWNARIRVGKVRYNLGNFLEEENAAKAYKEAQIKYDIIDKYSNYED